MVSTNIFDHWYTLTEFTSQYASLNASGFAATNSSHVAAPVFAEQSVHCVHAKPPASAPQKSVSKYCSLCQSQDQTRTMKERDEERGTHNRLRWKMDINITVSILALKVRRRRSPTTRLWVSTRNIRWDRVSRKEVNIDEVASPLHGINSTSVFIHRRPITAFLPNHTASNIAATIIAILIAGPYLSIRGRCERAVSFDVLGVQCGICLSDIAESFHNVNFTVGCSRGVTDCPTTNVAISSDIFGAF